MCHNLILAKLKIGTLPIRGERTGPSDGKRERLPWHSTTRRRRRRIKVSNFVPSFNNQETGTSNPSESPPPKDTGGWNLKVRNGFTKVNRYYFKYQVRSICEIWAFFPISEIKSVHFVELTGLKPQSRSRGPCGKIRAHPVILGFIAAEFQNCVERTSVLFSLPSPVQSCTHTCANAPVLPWPP